MKGTSSVKDNMRAGATTYQLILRVKNTNSRVCNCLCSYNQCILNVFILFYYQYHRSQSYIRDMSSHMEVDVDSVDCVDLNESDHINVIKFNMDRGDSLLLDTVNAITLMPDTDSLNERYFLNNTQIVNRSKT